MEGTKNTKVVLLCGGLGTRLREETEFKPKPMVDIGGRPILWHIMKIYSHYGFNDFVLCLGYKGESIRQYFLDQEVMGRDVTISLSRGKKIVHSKTGDVEDWNVTLADTGAESMTGTRIKKIEKYVDGDEFMLTYGDGVSNVDINTLLNKHRENKTIGTLTGVNPQSRFGMIKAEETGIVTEFVEKATMYDDYVNGGFYVFKKDLFDYLSEENSCVLEKKPLATLAEQKQLSMYKHKGFWHCMDTYRDYLDLNKIWDSGKAPWKVWE